MKNKIKKIDQIKCAFSENKFRSNNSEIIQVKSTLKKLACDTEFMFKFWFKSAMN